MTGVTGTDEYRLIAHHGATRTGARALLSAWDRTNEILRTQGEMSAEDVAVIHEMLTRNAAHAPHPCVEAY